MEDHNLIDEGFEEALSNEVEQGALWEHLHVLNNKLALQWATSKENEPDEEQAYGPGRRPRNTVKGEQGSSTNTNALVYTLKKNSGGSVVKLKKGVKHQKKVMSKLRKVFEDIGNRPMEQFQNNQIENDVVDITRQLERL